MNNWPPKPPIFRAARLDKSALSRVFWLIVIVLFIIVFPIIALATGGIIGLAAYIFCFWAINEMTKKWRA
jgi:hypothetical protein